MATVVVQASDRSVAHVERFINMPSIHALWQFYYTDMEILRIDDEVALRLFRTESFSIVVDGDYDLELDYLNTKHGKDAIERFCSEAAPYLRMFQLVVIAVRKDLFQWVQQRERTVLTAGPLELPFSVEQLEPTRGQLVLLEYPYADAPVRREWVYRPARNDNGYVYHVYTTTRGADVIPLATLNHIVSSAFVRSLQQSSYTSDSAGDYTLCSPFWELLRHRMTTSLVISNALAAGARAAHPPTFFTLRDVGTPSAHMLPAQALATAQSVTQARISERMHLSEEMTFYARSDLEYQQRQQQRRGFRQQRQNPSQRAPSRADILAAVYGLPRSLDDAHILHQAINGIHTAQAAILIDPYQQQAAYERQVRKCMGVPVQSVADTWNHGTWRPHPMISPGSGSPDATRMALSDQRAVMRGDRAMFSSLVEKAYELTLGRLDMAMIERDLDQWTEEKRARLALTLDPPFDPLRDKLRKRRPTKVRETLAKVLNSPETDVAKLRSKLKERIKAKKFLAVRMVFKLDQLDEVDDAESGYRPHEHLDALLLQHRQKEITQLASLVDVVLTRDELREHVAKLYDMDLEGPAPEPRLPEPRLPAEGEEEAATGRGQRARPKPDAAGSKGAKRTEKTKTSSSSRKRKDRDKEDDDDDDDSRRKKQPRLE